MKTIQLEQKSAQWLSFRQNGVGGSDIASVNKIKGSFKTHAQLMQDKLGLSNEAPSAFLQNLFKQGNEWEEVVRDTFNESQYNFVQVVAVKEDNDRLFASLDGVDVEKELVLEIKYCSTKSKFDEYKTKTPKHYYAQVQWELFVTGYTKAIIAYVHDGEVFVDNIDADIKYQHELLEGALEFLEALDNTRANQKEIKKLDESGELQVNKMVLLMQTEKEMKSQIKKLQDEIDNIANELLKTTNALRLEDDKMIIQTIERQGNVDYSKIKELENVDLDKYRKAGTSYVSVKLK